MEKKAFRLKMGNNQVSTDESLMPLDYARCSFVHIFKDLVP